MVPLSDEAYEFIFEKASYQIPRDPIYTKIDVLNTIAITCPRCKKILPSFTKNCCTYCGQLIKWANLKEQCNEDINR